MLRFFERRVTGFGLLACLGALLVVLGLAAPVSAQNCPNPNASGQALSYTGQQLWVPQSHPVTAGGNVDLRRCNRVQGSGYVARRPDFTLNLTRNQPGYDLEFRVEGTCDTVLLVRSPSGGWSFNDDSNGVNPRIRQSNAEVGAYDIWVGTYGSSLCQATLITETFGGTGGVAPPLSPPLVPPQTVACPNPNANGQRLTYTARQLWTPQRHGVTAGGTVTLGTCPNVPGHGRVAQRPDFTLDLTQNNPNYDLEFRVEGTCDTVLLVRGPDGQWTYNDDNGGVDPRLRLGRAAVGEYDIWVGTFGSSLCQATLIAETFGGNSGVVPPVSPPQVPRCPDPNANGQLLTYTGQQLWTPQRHGVTAGGAVTLGACPNVPGHGHVAQRPDFTLNFARNDPRYDLEFRVEANCDPVLLVRGPSGQWSFNDDSEGLNSRLRLPAAPTGSYDVWVGTFGTNTCPATLIVETFGGQPQQPPQPPQPALCPDPGQNGQMLTYNAQGLGVPQSHGVVAGGSLDLGACGSVPGHGHIIQRPDFTLNFTDNPQNHDLEFRVDGTCDPVLLVHGPYGQWLFNDDDAGLNSRLRVERAVPGAYDIWVGTFGSSTCQATLAMETFAPPVPVPPVPVTPPLPQGVLADPGNMTAYRGQDGQTFSFRVTGSASGAIWGTGVYTDDSPLARAAVHAGLLQVGQTGVVTVTVVPGQTSYNGTSSNGVESRAYGRWNGSYRLAMPVAPPPVDVLPDPGNMTRYRGQNGQVLRFEVTGATSGSVWGSDVYTDDSTIARAAVHAGVLRVGETGVVAVTVLPGRDGYAASRRNGIDSTAYGRWQGSYSFLIEPGAPSPGGSK
ncbi:LCCL domain-containing protein [Pararhodobacter zhoushanensis]|uniref:LCCL domain-containing protein n=1 Tax=Pararhodobacter zhoushanensis TaxID=2479545 RepID=UPI000F8EE283|nr:LCCL domain-containing protein [Pararhodobacter zhoushanensis]